LDHPSNPSPWIGHIPLSARNQVNVGVANGLPCSVATICADVETFNLRVFGFDSAL